MCFNDLLFIQLCSGTGVLSKEARKRSFKTIEVDNSKKRAPSKQVMRFDLSDARQCQEL